MGVWAAACGDATVVVQPVGCRALGHREWSTGLGLSKLTVHCGGGQSSIALVSWNGINCNRDTAGQLPAGGDQHPFREGSTLCRECVGPCSPAEACACSAPPPRRVAGRPLFPVLRWLRSPANISCQWVLVSLPAVSFKGYLRCLCPRYSIAPCPP